MRKKWILILFLFAQMGVPAQAGPALRFHEFAQVGIGSAGGGDIRTIFLILTQGDSPVNVTLSFFQDDGTPWEVTLEAFGTSTAFDLVVPANGSLRLTTPKTGALQTGWARLVAEELVGAQAFFEIFTAGTEELVTQAAVESAGPIRAADLFVEETASSLTGLAIVSLTGVSPSGFQNASQTRVELTLKDQNGAVLGTAEITLPSRGHAARFLRGLFPNLGTVRGTLVVRASGPISLTTLQQTGLILGILPPVKRVGA